VTSISSSASAPALPQQISFYRDGFGGPRPLFDQGTPDHRSLSAKGSKQNMSKLNIAVGAGIIGALSLFALSAAVGSLSARGWQETGHGEHGFGHRGGHGTKSTYRLKQLDSDNDGEVTLMEFIGPKEVRFAELDTDGNGILSPEELFKDLDAEVDYRVLRTLKRFDTDGDGKITKEEYNEHTRKRFAQKDFDGDGRIGDDEMSPRWKHRGGDKAESEKAPSGDDSAQAGEKPKASEESEKQSGGKTERWRGHRHGYGHWQKTRTLDEALDRSAQKFARRDTNSDGVIDADEIRARGANRLEYMKKKRMHRLDADKDGTVSKEEYLARAKEWFAMIDLDGDGVITAKDLPPRAARRWNDEQGNRN
jgi:Ca2+-binding EF-hand superfamily protein